MSEYRSIWNVEVKPGVGTALGLGAVGLGAMSFLWSGGISGFNMLHLPMRVVIGICVVAGLIAVIGFVIDLLNSYVRQPKPIQIGDAVLSWQAAEQLAAAHMRTFGFTDARTTPKGADGGLDVVSRYGVAQVKFFSKPVGRPDVQKLRGAAHGKQRVLFYALSGYTPAAVEFADSATVALFAFDQFGRVWPVNGLAKGYRKPEPVNA